MTPKNKKLQYCTIVFYLKQNKKKIDSSAKIIQFDKEKIVVESNFLRINENLIDSVSISLIECANMQISINATLDSIQYHNTKTKYILNTPLKKDININGHVYPVYNQSVLKKLNIHRNL